MKMNMGGVYSSEAEKWYDIIVEAKTPNRLVDILIGGGMVVAGICYLTTKAFKNGVWTYEKEEVKTLMEAGVMGDIDENNNVMMGETDIRYKSKT